MFAPLKVQGLAQPIQVSVSEEHFLILQLICSSVFASIKVIYIEQVKAKRKESRTKEKIPEVECIKLTGSFLFQIFFFLCLAIPLSTDTICRVCELGRSLWAVC